MPDAPKTFEEFRASCPSMDGIEAAVSKLAWNAAITAAVGECQDEARLYLESSQAIDKSGDVHRGTIELHGNLASHVCAARIAKLATSECK